MKKEKETFFVCLVIMNLQLLFVVYGLATGWQKEKNSPIKRCPTNVSVFQFHNNSFSKYFRTIYEKH